MPVSMSAFLMMSALLEAMLGSATSCINSATICRSWAARHSRTLTTAGEGAARSTTPPNTTMTADHAWTIRFMTAV